MDHFFNKTINFSLVLIALLALPFTSLANQDPDILFLNSYYLGYEWSDNIVKSFQYEINNAFQNPIISIEYMDSKQFKSDEYYQSLADLYYYKYHDNKPDVIVCSDDNAFQFVMNYYNDLFKDIPFVFCGVGKIDQKYIENHKNFTGIIEHLDIQATINLINKFHPDLENLYIITENTITGVSQKEATESQEQQFPDINFRYFDGRYLTTYQLLDKIKQLPEHSALLPLTWMRDASGEVFDNEIIYPLIINSSNVPVYSTGEIMMGMGVIGGMLNSGFNQGELAAMLTLKILNGEKPENIPIVVDTHNPCMLDYQMIKKYKIDTNLIPANSIIINKPISLYEKHKSVIWIAISINSILAFIIAILIINIISRHKTEKALRQSRMQYKTLVETAPESVIMLDFEGTILFASDHTWSMFNLPADQALENKKVTAFIDKKNLDEINNFNLQLKNLKTVRNKEIIFKRADNSRFIGEINASYILGIDSIPNAIIATVRDISGRKEYEDMIKKSLLEKEILLKEIHHRVKNNMQVICSLLSLQEKYIPDPESLKVFQETKSRVMSMALIHERMYRSEDLAEINFKEYIQNLIVDLGHTYNTDNKLFSFDIKGPDIFLDLNRAIPCGLILNELVTNAIKYAFPDNQPGTINIKLDTSSNRFSILVKDDGIGIPQGFNPETSTTFGYKMIHALISQIEGELIVQRNNGTIVQFSFNS